MKRILISLTLATLLGLGNIPTAHAYASLSGCLSGRGSGSVSGTTLTLTINLTITCTATDPKDPTKPATFYSLFYVDFPVYEIQEELFSSSACNGPLLGLTRMISGTNAGIVTCRLSNSSRYGATTSTLKIYTGDAVFVPISHPAIPKPGSSGGSSSGGSSSGSSSGGTTGTTVVPTCTAAPDTPNLSIEWNTTGPKFTFYPALGGQKATALFWSYALLNSVSNTWESWSNSVVAPVATGTYQASVTEGKSRIAFSVQAANACGGSAQAREVNGNTGVALAPLLEDEIINVQPLPLKILTGTAPALSVFAKSSLGLELEATTLAPDVCIVDAVPTVRMLKPGTCKLSVKTTTFQNKIGAKTIEITFEVTNPRSPQVILTYPFPSQYELSLGSTNVYMKTSTGLLAHFEASTDDICFVAGGTLVFKSVGYCNFTASQDGDEANLPAESKYFQFQIIDSRKTLLCLKGKTSKKVLGINPKCPVGYKVKK